ncbi:hypothetical protein BDC45DRAFT_569541 [Circinella umbellata]|nr:hypothetical protein BDC45DRAFT_569541 [Circinella umbellata]
MIQHIELLSVQFHGLERIVHGSKMTEHGDYIHYQRCKISLPTTAGYFSQAASFLSTVISLQRNILICFQKIQIMCEIVYQDAVHYLELPISNNEVFCREDTPESDTSSVTSTISVESNGDWCVGVKKQRITDLVNQKLAELCYG